MTLHWGTADDDQCNFWTIIRISFVKLEALPCIHENSVMHFGCFCRMNQNGIFHLTIELIMNTRSEARHAASRQNWQQRENVLFKD